MFRDLRADEIECRCRASEDGTVTDADGKVLKQYKERNGYMRVFIKENGKRKKVLVHRLVAMAFIPNPENKPCVNHIDGDKSNNRASNLEWCTYSENEYHSYRVLGKRVKPEHLAKIHAIRRDRASTPVSQKTLDGKLVNTFSSMAEAQKATGIRQGNISECCNNKRKTAGGYVWCFVI